MNDSTTRKLKAQRIRDMAKMVAEFRERPEYNEASLAISEDLDLQSQYREIEKFCRKELADTGSKFLFNPYLTYYLDPHKRESAYSFKSKAIYVLEQFDYDSMIDEVKRLLKSEEEPPIPKDVKLLNSMAVAYWVRNPWQENRILMQGNGVINTARMLADCLSTLSLKEIQEQADGKNPLATLRLADCYMYGLKGLRRDEDMAQELYQDAAAYGSLEARMQVAKLIYDMIIEECANGEDDKRTSFPIQRENSEGHEMKVFWSHMEVAADFDYVTPFMIDMLVAAKHTGTWPLCKKLENILARFETQLDAEIRSEKASYKFSCRAARCLVRFNDQALMVVCGQCKLPRYCCKACQFDDWKAGHDRKCKPAQNKTIDTPSELSRRAIFTENGMLISSSTLCSEALKMQRELLEIDEIDGSMKALQEIERKGNIFSNIRQQASCNRGLADLDLKLEADSAIKRGHFRDAVRCLTLAIDKMEMENTVFQEQYHRSSKTTLINLIELYRCRMRCQMEANEQPRISSATKLNNLGSVVQDCAFLLRTGLFSEEIQPGDEIHNELTEIETRALLAKVTLEQSQNTNRRRSGRRRAQNRENSRNDQNAQEEEETIDGQEESNPDGTAKEMGLLEVTTTLHVIQGDYNANRKKTSPIISTDDTCSICLCQWDQFSDIAIVVVLNCSHTYCASCLADMHKECVRTQNDKMGTYKLPFCCSLCRSTIKPEILDDLAVTVVDKGLIVSFVQFIDQSASYEASKEERKRMLVSVLAKTCQFDVVKAEIHLFNLLQMILHDSSLDLNSGQKSEYFELARAPVCQLEAERNRLRLELDNMCRMESAEWKSLHSKIQRLNKKIAEARSNATKDIFERVNSSGQMGVCGADKHLKVDLHGLFVEEAKEVIETFVLPVLPVIGKLMLITGRGVHNKTKMAKLKLALKKHFSEIKIRCEELSDNEGALVIFSQ